MSADAGLQLLRQPVVTRGSEQFERRIACVARPQRVELLSEVLQRVPLLGIQSAS